MQRNRPTMTYELERIQKIVEGALLASGEALNLDRLLSLFDEHERPEKDVLQDALRGIESNCADRGFHLVQVASGWRFQVRSDLAPWVNRLWEEKPQKYSRAILETLALIAYRQPLTRGDIEQVRGVSVSSHIVKSLAEREWIKVVGHRDVPGRPALYATTRQFLDYFGLKSLDELPTLNELKDFDMLDSDSAQDDEPAGDLESEQIREALHSGEEMETTPAAIEPFRHERHPSDAVDENESEISGDLLESGDTDIKPADDQQL